MNVYDIGDQVRAQTVFKNAAGTATDPSGVTVRVHEPDGTATTYTYGTDAEVVKSATGTYYIDITPDAAGAWSYRWAGTGSLVGAEETAFAVRRSEA